MLEDSLVTFGGDGDDLVLALARQIVSGEDSDAGGESVEQVFALVRDAKSSAEEFMLDDGWKATEAEPVVELEPEFVEVHGNGNDVEAVVVNTNYNGHYGELAEGQHSLSSWDEFLAEEPAQRQGRNGKPKPLSHSLFELAFNAEQGRDKELVGEGR